MMMETGTGSDEMGSVIPGPAPVTYLTSSSRPEVLGINTWTSGMKDNHHHAREYLQSLDILSTFMCVSGAEDVTCVCRCQFLICPLSGGWGPWHRMLLTSDPGGAVTSADGWDRLRLRVGDIYRVTADVCTVCTCYYFYSHRVWGVETIANELGVKIARSNFYQQALDTDRGHRISAKMTPKNKLA